MKVVWAETPAAVIAEAEENLPKAEEVTLGAVDEFMTDNFDFDLNLDFDEAEDEDEDLPDLEEELEIALEASHQKEVKKQRLITGISAGVALLGAIGLATGFAIHSHFKKK